MTGSGRTSPLLALRAASLQGSVNGKYPRVFGRLESNYVMII